MPPKQSGEIAEGAPLLKAHEHAALADDLHSRGELSAAIAEHTKAAEEYLKSVEYTEDASLQATLRRMHLEQTKLAEELKRRLAIQERASRASGSKPPRRPFTYPPPQEESRPPSRVPSQSQISSMVMPRMQDSALSDKTSGGESFMVLGGDWSEAGERFNRFWGNVEGMLEKFSQPVAFASAPLTPWEPSDSGSGDTDYEDASPVAVATASASAAPRRHVDPPTTKGKSATTPKGHTKAKSGQSPKVISLDFEEDSSDSESFYMVPSNNKPASRMPSVVQSIVGPSTAQLLRQKEEENKKLKAELEAVRIKLARADNIIKVRAGQDAQLRDSIMFAKREAQRHLVGSTAFRNPALAGVPPGSSQHLLANTAILDPNNSPFSNASNQVTNSPVTPQAPPPGPSTASLQKRIKDLEEELRQVKAENEKQKAQISRFRDKWQNLKESARRKRSQKDAANLADGMREMSIKEEDEDEIVREVAAAPIAIVPGQYQHQTSAGDFTPRGSMTQAAG